MGSNPTEGTTNLLVSLGIVKNKNKLLIAIQGIFISAFLLISGLALFDAHWNLRDPRINEVNKKIALALESSVMTEFEPDGSPYWWITKEGVGLTYTNTTQERVVGNLALTFKPNPCLQEKSIDLISRNKTVGRLEIGNLGKFRTNVAIDLEPYQKITITLNTLDTVLCKVDNGDERDFVAKLQGWKFD